MPIASPTGSNTINKGLPCEVAEASLCREKMVVSGAYRKTLPGHRITSIVYELTKGVDPLFTRDPIGCYASMHRVRRLKSLLNYASVNRKAILLRLCKSVIPVHRISVSLTHCIMTEKAVQYSLLYTLKKVKIIIAIGMSLMYHIKYGIWDSMHNDYSLRREEYAFQKTCYSKASYTLGKKA